MGAKELIQQTIFDSRGISKPFVELSDFIHAIHVHSTIAQMEYDGIELFRLFALLEVDDLHVPQSCDTAISARTLFAIASSPAGVSCRWVERLVL